VTLRLIASTVLIAVALSWVIGSGAAPAASGTIAQSGPASTTMLLAPGDTFPDVTSPEVTLPNIIPYIDSGTAPAHATDRGGSAQLAVLGLIIAALAVIGLLMWRESRRKRRQA
jgi:hypothetical protein